MDAGVPDGLQVDLKGNVYSGCGDGVQVRFNVPELLNMPLTVLGVERRGYTAWEVLPRHHFGQYGVRQ